MSQLTFYSKDDIRYAIEIYMEILIFRLLVTQNIHFITHGTYKVKAITLEGYLLICQIKLEINTIKRLFLDYRLIIY